jgi:hypothetical protein
MSKINDFRQIEQFDIAAFNPHAIAHGQTLFYVYRKNSGRADTFLFVDKPLTLRLSAETGANGGGGADSGTWARFAIYINGTELPGADAGSNFNDWNGLCEAVFTFQPNIRYSIVADQSNGGCTVINTYLKGVVE